MSGLFITSSGTEIGKTFVASRMCRELFARGKSVAAYKPVISDFDSSDFGGSDSAILLQSIGKKVSMANIEAISPWRFKAPLSPDMAARRENREINFSDLLSFCAQALSGPEDVKIIEGIGGLMVPLTSSHIWHDGDQ